MRISSVLILPAALAMAAQTGPRLIEKSAADYTEEARLARLEGSALVTLVVDEDGTSRDVHITRPIGLGLDDKAIESVKQWQFVPAKQDEKPVLSVIHVDVDFRLLIGRGDWHLARAAFDTPAGATRPVLIKAEYPEAERSEQSAAVTVSFLVDEQGVPADLHADKSSDPRWEDEIVRTASAWRFRPATADGHAVSVHCTLDFMRGHTTESE